VPDIDQRRKPRFVLRLDDSTYAALATAADDTGRSMSELATEAVQALVGLAQGQWRGKAATTR
jgi:predicted HicB family RNase H-like nuclease